MIIRLYCWQFGLLRGSVLVNITLQVSSTWIGDGVTSLINKWITNPENWVYLLAPS
jgi:hypothetical protein